VAAEAPMVDAAVGVRLKAGPLCSSDHGVDGLAAHDLGSVLVDE